MYIYIVLIRRIIDLKKWKFWKLNYFVVNLFDHTRGDNGDYKVKATDLFMGVLTISG